MNEAVFRGWYRAAGPWAQWLKPSLLTGLVESGPAGEPTRPPIDWLPATRETALILDLPGVDAVHLGAALNAAGACPVPLFNTTSGSGEAVATAPLIAALVQLAPSLAAQAEGPPVFLLDAHRESTGPVAPGDFDNRWYVFSSDFPTVERLRAAGIRSLVVVTEHLRADLQDALVHHASLEPKVLSPSSREVRPLPKGRSAILRTLSTFGRVLHKNLDGSFGHRLSQG